MKSLLERVGDKFLMGGEGCWPWTASLDGKGYGQINSGGRGKPLRAHRVVYELARGPIPEGLHLDHLCRNPVCVRPDHLEPVTQAENIRRGLAGEATRIRAAQQTHCKRGHEFTAQNTKMDTNPNGNPKRKCRKCAALWQRAYIAGGGGSDGLG